MGARFLIRFDDICPTMNWGVWYQVEAILDRFGVKPILAVVPDNRDSNLVVDTPKGDFWERVRHWQGQGWAIALHGYHHVYETKSSGLLGINKCSEFAGLPYDVQRSNIERALAVFSKEGIRADAWVAPAHSFDAITVQALGELGIRVISDGFHWRPVFSTGALWIPQQMWRFRPMPGGVWTVCFHHNHLTAGNIQKLGEDIVRYRQQIVSLGDLVNRYPAKTRSVLDKSFSALWLGGLRFKRRMAWPR